MKTELITQQNGQGNWIAFLFGAVFNLLASANLRFLIDYTLQATVGGVVCLIFKIVGDIITAAWKRRKHQSRLIRRRRAK